MEDCPKSLCEEAARDQRKQMLGREHMKPLKDFVEKIRKERGCKEQVPDFDPLDGGINAECLFVLEAPGPKAVKSGFISRNNPDESAKNFFECNQEAGIPRERTITWNIVPWYIGSNGKIRPAKSGDIEPGLGYLLELIALLQKLRIIVLIGRKAQRVKVDLSKNGTHAIIECYHPSPMYINRDKSNKGKIIDALRRVAKELAGQEAGVTL